MDPRIARIQAAQKMPLPRLTADALSPRVVHIHRPPEPRSICLRCGAPFEEVSP